MLRFALFVLLTALVCDVESGGVDAPERADDFTCYPNQTIHFNNPNPSLLINYRAFYNDGSGIQECTSNTPDNHINVYFSCSATNYSITAYFSDRNLTDNIIGGEGVRYTFTCNQLEDYNQTFIGNLTAVSVNHTVESSTPEHDITSRFVEYTVIVPSPLTITNATVGDTILFEIEAPGNYTMKALSCVAAGGDDTKTVITNGCSDETNLVSDFRVFNHPTGHWTYLYMNFYVFKFYNADDVTLTCSVKICISGDDCDFSCGSDRRRRALSEQDGDDEEVFSVNQRLIVKDAVPSRSTLIYGPLNLTVAMLIVLLV